MIKVIASSLVFFGLVFLFLSILFTHGLWSGITNPQTSFSLGVFEEDSLLGYKCIPNNLGFYYFKTKKVVPIYSNDLGFRKISSNKLEDSDMLFFGDSYSFGDGVSNQETFPYLVDSLTQNKVFNFGVSGYSYAQVLRLIQSVDLNQLSARTLFFQLSPWLDERSCNEKLEPFVRIQVPFIAYQNEKVTLFPPNYLSSIFNVLRQNDVEQYKNGEAGWLRFYLNFGSKLFWKIVCDEVTNSYKFLAYTKIKNPLEVERFYLEVLSELSLSHDFDVVILNIGYDVEGFREIKSDYSNSSLLFLDLEDRLQRKLCDGCSYEKEYMHWNQDRTELIDRHYNQVAHQICSEAIVEYFSKHPH